MDEEYADIYYVDTRNATSRDHRTQQQGRSPLPWVRPRQPVSPTRTVYVPPAPQQAFAQPQPMYHQPVYQQPQPMIYTGPQPMTGMGALFGRLTTGQIIEMIAQGFAALQSLPTAPVSTRELETDIANLVLYQGAIASHAKRDEQVRTLGSLVSKLVG
jgi:hypothetical protein